MDHAGFQTPPIVDTTRKCDPFMPTPPSAKAVLKAPKQAVPHSTGSVNLTMSASTISSCAYDLCRSGLADLVQEAAENDTAVAKMHSTITSSHGFSWTDFSTPKTDLDSSRSSCTTLSAGEDIDSTLAEWDSHANDALGEVGNSLSPIPPQDLRHDPMLALKSCDSLSCAAMPLPDEDFNDLGWLCGAPKVPSCRDY